MDRQNKQHRNIHSQADQSNQSVQTSALTAVWQFLILLQSGTTTNNLDHMLPNAPGDITTTMVHNRIGKVLRNIES